MSQYATMAMLALVKAADAFCEAEQALQAARRGGSTPKQRIEIYRRYEVAHAELWTAVRLYGDRPRRAAA